jgi:YegS/Rv2252/BmrU family lipid kinase
MGRKIYVVLNGKAGKAGRFGLDNAQKTIQDAFHKTDPDVDVEFGITQAPFHAPELARKAAETGQYYAVCAAGGDGTVNEVTNGMVHTGVAMGVLPWGSGNVFAQEMAISNNVEEAAALVLNGQIRDVDTGQVGDRYYLWMLGIGVEAKIAYYVNPTIKKYLGVLSYVVAAARQIFDPGYSLMRITLDDQEMTFTTFNTIVGNATSFDGFLGIKSSYSIKDGFLDVCILQKKSVGGILKLLIEFIKGRKDYYRFIDKFSAAHCRVKSLRIDTVPNAYYHVDGEVMGMTPVDIRVHAGSLKLIFPG